MECEAIVSSSLHGLVIAESFGIRSTWMKLSENLAGGEFKFHDYFLGTGRAKVSPLMANDFNEFNIKKYEIPKISDIDAIQDLLLENFPIDFHSKGYNSSMYYLFVN